MKLTDTQQWIVSYLEENKDKGWLSPTIIGNAYGGSAHSGWASPRCLKLVEMGILERSYMGWYRIKMRSR